MTSPLRHAVATAALALALLPVAAAPAVGAADGLAPGTTPEVIGGALLGGRGDVVAGGPGVDPLPAVTARTFLVADADSGAVLAARGAHVRMRPASTLKVLTALTALREGIAPEAAYTAGREDADQIGTRVGLYAGSSYTARDLMYGMFVSSGNDAANAMANLGGGVKPFVEKMNAVARSLQARDTTVVMPSGLDEPGQFTSAYDLALIGRAAAQEPVLRAYASTRVYRFPDKEPTPGKKRGTVEIRSLQRFLWNYDGAFGLKNGFTSLGRQTLVAASSREGRTILVTLLGTDAIAWREAAALSDWAYANAARVTPVGELVSPVQEDSAELAKPVVRPAAPLGLWQQPGLPAEPALILAASIGLAGGLLVWLGQPRPSSRGATTTGQRPRSSRERRTPVPTEALQARASITPSARSSADRGAGGRPGP